MFIILCSLYFTAGFKLLGGVYMLLCKRKIVYDPEKSVDVCFLKVLQKLFAFATEIYEQLTKMEHISVYIYLKALSLANGTAIFAKEH